VLFEPAPAMMGTRPAAACTAAATMAPCSAWLSVGDSPVVPHTTMADEPCSICQCTRRVSVGRSTASFRKGVTRAGMEAENMVI